LRKRKRDEKNIVETSSPKEENPKKESEKETEISKESSTVESIVNKVIRTTDEELMAKM